PLLLVWPPGGIDSERQHALQRFFLIGRDRTPEQDVEFGIKQIVEIAVRSLSPGINDPFTAASCIDWLGDALCRIAESDLHSPYRYDEQNVLRVIADVSTFAGIVDASFDQIRLYGHENSVIVCRVL